MSTEIRIACKAADALDWKSLEPFQGNLKDLTKENYAKLRTEIANEGFSAPIFVWKQDGHNYVLDGHQRLRAVKEMVEKEGFTCPPLPVAYVEADSLEQAKRKLLAIASQYGSLNREGLYEYITEQNIEFKELTARFQFPEIDFQRFDAEFFSHTLVENQQDEWRGMPHFENEKVAFQSILVHLKDQDAVEKFAKLMDQPITESTRHLWYPEEERDRVKNLRYRSES